MCGIHCSAQRHESPAGAGPGQEGDVVLVVPPAGDAVDDAAGHVLERRRVLDVVAPAALQHRRVERVEARRPRHQVVGERAQPLAVGSGQPSRSAERGSPRRRPRRCWRSRPATSSRSRSRAGRRTRRGARRRAAGRAAAGSRTGSATASTRARGVQRTSVERGRRAASAAPTCRARRQHLARTAAVPPPAGPASAAWKNGRPSTSATQVADARRRPRVARPAATSARRRAALDGSRRVAPPRDAAARDELGGRQQRAVVVDRRTPRRRTGTRGCAPRGARTRGARRRGTGRGVKSPSSSRVEARASAAIASPPPCRYAACQRWVRTLSCSGALMTRSSRCFVSASKIAV